MDMNTGIENLALILLVAAIGVFACVIFFTNSKRYNPEQKEDNQKLCENIKRYQHVCSIEKMYLYIKRMHKELNIKEPKDERVSNLTKLIEHTICLEKNKELEQYCASQFKRCMSCYFFNRE